MFLRTIAITVALALGLLLILGMAFVICIPAYLLELLHLRPRASSPASTGVRLPHSALPRSPYTRF